MPQLWCPDAIQDPGTAAGYRFGRNLLRTVKLHYTAGVNSYAICKYGRASEGGVSLCQFLFPKIGQPWQFTEVDAYCQDSGTWNSEGPGLEFERLSYEEPLSPDQIKYGSKVIAWLHAEQGFPLTLWDGARVISTDCGFINHGSVLGRQLSNGSMERADHTDGVLRSEWDAMIRPIAVEIPPNDFSNLGDTIMMFDFNGDTITFHIDQAGKLIQNTYRYVGGQVLKNAVILEGNDPNYPPSVIVHGNTFNVALVDPQGRGRFITFLSGGPGDGWVDANGKKLH